MPTVKRIDFATLKRPGAPNTFLTAPEGLCAHAKPDVVAPVFEIAAAQLRQEFLSVALAEPRVSHTLADEKGLYDDLVVRSAVFGFPDLVSVQFLPLSNGTSTLALYSRAVHGLWDLGVNRARAQAWLARVGRAIQPVKA